MFVFLQPCNLYFSALQIHLRRYTHIKSWPKRKATEANTDNAKHSPVLIYVNWPQTKMIEAAQQHESPAVRDGSNLHCAYRVLCDVRSGLVICLVLWQKVLQWRENVRLLATELGDQDIPGEDIHKLQLGGMDSEKKARQNVTRPSGYQGLAKL